MMKRRTVDMCKLYTICLCLVKYFLYQYYVLISNWNKSSRTLGFEFSLVLSRQNLYSLSVCRTSTSYTLSFNVFMGLQFRQTNIDNILVWEQPGGFFTFALQYKRQRTFQKPLSFTFVYRTFYLCIQRKET